MEKEPDLVSMDNPFNPFPGGDITDEIPYSEIVLKYDPSDEQRIRSPEHISRFIKGRDPDKMQLLATSPGKAAIAIAWLLRRKPTYYAYLTTGQEQAKSNNKLQGE